MLNPKSQRKHTLELIFCFAFHTVATYPLAGVRKGQNRQAKVFVSKGENERSCHQHLFEENVRKTKKGLRILKMRVWELFTHGEGISTQHTRHKGRQSLIECAKHDFKIMYFPILCLLFFWGRQGCCSCSYISSGAMRNSDLRSSLSLKVCVLH